MGITLTGLGEGMTELTQSLAHGECSTKVAIIVIIKHNMNVRKESGPVLGT